MVGLRLFKDKENDWNSPEWWDEWACALNTRLKCSLFYNFAWHSLHLLTDVTRANSLEAFLSFFLKTTLNFFNNFFRLPFHFFISFCTVIRGFCKLNTQIAPIALKQQNVLSPIIIKPQPIFLAFLNPIPKKPEKLSNQLINCFCILLASSPFFIFCW